MIGLAFLIASCTSVATYLLAASWLHARERKVVLARLNGRAATRRNVRSDGEPLLMQLGDEEQGRMARRFLEGMRLKQRAEQLLETAGLKWGAVGLLHRSVALFLTCFAAGTILTGNRHGPYLALVSLPAGFLPLFYVRHKATHRVRGFEAQFPECLEFIARSMRAGHAFSVALEMVHREFSDPLAGEFRRCFEEQNLGQPLDIVLRKLGQRIPSLDTQFFISAVLLQKRTGGNLAELLDKLANLIRERFKLRARIRAISAQGMMSGRILSAIPAGVGGLMFVVNPQYARFFVDDPVGHQLLAASLGMQLLGYLIIRKIVTIEV